MANTAGQWPVARPNWLLCACPTPQASYAVACNVKSKSLPLLLHSACKRDDAAGWRLRQWALDHGASIDGLTGLGYDTNRETILEALCSTHTNPNVEGVRWLLEQGAAIRPGSALIARIFQSMCFMDLPSERIRKLTGNAEYWVPERVEKYSQLLRLVYEAGADPNENQQIWGASRPRAIHFAARYRAPIPLLGILKAIGADLTAPFTNDTGVRYPGNMTGGGIRVGATPLQIARESRCNRETLRWFEQNS